MVNALGLNADKAYLFSKCLSSCDSSYETLHRIMSSQFLVFSSSEIWEKEEKEKEAQKGVVWSGIVTAWWTAETTNFSLVFISWNLRSLRHCYVARLEWFYVRRWWIVHVRRSFASWSSCETIRLDLRGVISVTWRENAKFEFRFVEATWPWIAKRKYPFRKALTEQFALSEYFQTNVHCVF